MRLLTVAAAAVVAIVLIGASPAGAKGGQSDTPDLVGTRTTDADIDLRVYDARWRAPAADVGARRVPTSCFANRQLLVGVSSPRVASSIESLWRAEDELDGRAIIAVIGSWERSPIGVVMMLAPPRAHRASARFQGGATDDAEVVGGWIVLAAELPRRQFSADGVVSAGAKVVVVDDDNKVISKGYAEDSSRAPGRAYARANRPECSTALSP